MGGCPRSGTTLLQVMLDMHPELGMPRETNFIRELWWRRRHFGDLRDPANRRRVAEWIFSDKEHLFRRLIHRRITREEAIRMYTIGSAYMTSEEHLKGSLEPGKLADLIVLDRDILRCPEDEIKDAEVLVTLVGGRVVHGDLGTL